MSLKAKITKKKAIKPIFVDHDIENTKLKLIEAAKVLFSKKGFAETTVKDLADEAGVNVSLVSYYFDGKAGLYRACLDKFGRERFAVAQRILQHPKNLDEFKIRLEMVVHEICGVHTDQTEVCQILNRELDNQAPLAEDIFRNTFLKCSELLVEFMKVSQKEGFIRKDLKPEIIAMLFFGSILHTTNKDAVNEKFHGVSLKDEKFRKEFVHTVLTLFVEGIKT